MNDQPSLDYTINDPSSVECPHCHEKMDLSGLGLENGREWGGHCELCQKYIQFEVQTDVTVLAYKPGTKE